MTGRDWRERTRALVLVSVLIGAVVAGGIGGTGIAAGTVEDAELHDIDGETDSDERFVAPGQQINVNYTANVSDDALVEDVTLTFENTATGETVERDLPDQEVENRNETVDAPDTEGEYDVTLTVSDEDGDETATFEEFLVVHTEKPTVNIEAPEDDSSQMETPTVEGTAFDGAGIQNVTMSVQNESGYYWNDSDGAWQDSEAAFVVEDPTATDTRGETVDWEYDFYDEIDQQGEFTVTVDAHDGKNNSLGESADVPSPDDSVTPSVTFEWVMGAPSIEDVTVTAPDQVEDGDEIGLDVEVDERGANDVDSVTVDASGLGIEEESLPLESENDGTHTFDGNVTVSDPTAPEGDVALTLTATEPSEGLEDTDTETVELDRVPADVDSVEVDAEFLGIVEDEAADEGIDVTVSGVTDAQGNTVSGNIDVVVAGTTLASETVEDGDATTTIDPTDIPNDSVTAGTVEIRADGETIGTADVELVHHVYGLADGTYQAVGTPMESEQVLIDADVSEVQRYDTAEEDWEAVADASEIADAGTGYYVYAEGENPRIGYEFETDSVDDTTPTETLQSGFNLVGASVQLDEDADQDLSVEDDLNHESAKDLNDTKVTAYTPADDDVVATEDDPENLDWSTADGNFDSTDVSATAAYWVYVEDGTLERTYETDAYDPDA